MRWSSGHCIALKALSIPQTSSSESHRWTCRLELYVDWQACCNCLSACASSVSTLESRLSRGSAWGKWDGALVAQNSALHAWQRTCLPCSSIGTCSFLPHVGHAPTKRMDPVIDLLPCLPENPVCPKILKGETWSLPPSRELIIVAYSSSVNILTWFSSPVCHVKLHGWGGGTGETRGKPGGKMDGGTGRRTGRGTQGVRGVPFDRWSRRLGLVVGMGFRGIVDDVALEC